MDLLKGKSIDNDPEISTVFPAATESAGFPSYDKFILAKDTTEHKHEEEHREYQEAERVPLCSSVNKDDHSDTDGDPFVTEENILLTLKKQMKYWFVGNVLLLLVWTVFFSVSVALYYKHMEGCTHSNEFGL